MERVSRDELCAEMAAVVAKRGTCGRAQVGALISRDGRILATGYNGPPSGFPHCTDPDGCTDADRTDPGGCVRAVHAEANAIAFAARHGIATQGADLFCSHLPCKRCAELIINSGIVRVHYTSDYRIKDGEVLLRQAGIDIVQL